VDSALWNEARVALLKESCPEGYLRTGIDIQLQPMAAVKLHFTE